MPGARSTSLLSSTRDSRKAHNLNGVRGWVRATVRQPLRRMGVVAAETLLKRITAPVGAEYPKEIVPEPEIVVRESTAPMEQPFA